MLTKIESNEKQFLENDLDNSLKLISFGIKAGEKTKYKTESESFTQTAVAIALEANSKLTPNFTFGKKTKSLSELQQKPWT